MKVSRTMAYAVQAMLHLAIIDSDDPVSCSKLAKKGKMPERFLLQVLRTLVNHGLLHSSRGVEGGYYLAYDPSDITLLDIFEAFGHTVVPSIAPLRGLPATTRKVLDSALESGAAAAEQELSRVSLADLIGKQAKKKTKKK